MKEKIISFEETNEFGYIIICNGTLDEFDEYNKIFEQMIESFKFLETK
jgi:hypothetical protein